MLTPLPLDSAWPHIEKALNAHRNLVLVAEPGAGKTTRFPPLLRNWMKKRILVLQPRRIAARSSATRIATEQHWKLGEAEVGYQVRFENRTRPTTDIIFLTEALLFRHLQDDPRLEDIGAVILDEFHERSRHLDLAIGILKELQQLERPDLRIVVMSATIDADKVGNFLEDAECLHIPGQLHPLSEVFHSHPLTLNSDEMCDRMTETIESVILQNKPSARDLLCFLPGQREIRRCRERLKCKPDMIFELHGQMNLEDQNRVVRKTETQRRVILSTNIAESSLTIDDVGTVIDSGIAREASVDEFGFTRLQLKRISKASTIQRAGRAARLGPGFCYHLWSQQDASSFPAYDKPEILRSDLLDEVLALATLGVQARSFTWYEAPDSFRLQHAQDELRLMGLLDQDFGLSKRGRAAAQLGLDPRLANLVIHGEELGVPQLAARVAALLSERDIPVPALPSIESDLWPRLEWLQTSKDPSRHRIIQVADEIQRRIGPRPTANKKDSEEKQLERLLLAAFPDRLGRRRRSGQPEFRMMGGRGLSLAPRSPLGRTEFMVALSLQETKDGPMISMASAISEDSIETEFKKEISTKTICRWDDDKSMVIGERSRFLRDLPLQNPDPVPVDAEQAFPILKLALQQRLAKIWKDPSLQPLIERWGWIAQALNLTSPPSRFENISSDLKSGLDAWLDEICYGQTRWPSFEAESLLRHLPNELSQALKTQAPDHLLSPRGRTVKIHYDNPAGPYISIRIQDAFGWKTTPTLSGRPLTLHLLAPNGRVSQVTSDLAQFWKSSYLDVRKELRGRYPKHAWPEDPTVFDPSQVRPSKSKSDDR